MANQRLVIAGNAATPELTINANSIFSLRSNLSSSIDGSEVAVDTCETTILADYSVSVGLLVPNDADSVTTIDGDLVYVGVNEQILPQIPYGTEIRYYEGTQLIGLWYLENVTRVSRDTYQVNMISGLGLLDNVSHAGGIYSGTALSTVLADIIGNTFTYTVDSGISGWKVYGWLPYSTARENLHQILLAMGVNIFKNADGSPRFGVLSSANPITVPDTEVYTDGKVGYGAPATSIAVTEHQWAAFPADAEKLFDNTDGSAAADHTIVVFDDPHYNLTASGNLTVNASGVNYAELTGVGVLTGKPYTHIQRVIRKTSGAANAKPREITVKDAYLVNGLNSLNVADRLLSYYADAHTISGKMIWGTARPGSAVVISNAFGESETAIVSKMDLISSATLAASFEAAANYEPGAPGNNYTNRVLKTASGSWQKPSGVTKVRVALIGGGQGGQSGGNGEKGQNGSQGGGGAGGIGGQPGSGGNVYVIDLELPSAALTMSATIGAGGAGGKAPYETAVGGVNYGTSGAAPVDGSAGGASTVSYTVAGVTKTLTSANGQPSENGYVDIINGDVVGLPGTGVGVAGGAGGGSTTTPGSVTYGGTTWIGGATGDSSVAGGGKGGGAAVGNNGGDGGDSGTANGLAYGGNGGKGADAIANTFSGGYGQGGNGGHGSGGGGAGGGAASTLLSGSGGQAGVGGDGSVGGAGCVIFYY